MRVLHLAAGNRWTGAAAPAFAEVEALRQAGIDAHFAYVGGYKLHAKLRHHDFAHPIIARAQNPVSFLRTAGILEKLIERHGFDIVHAHLTYDHWLARVAVHDTPSKLVRTFHARRVLRADPFTRSLVRRSDAICVVNDTFGESEAVRRSHPVFTPPPLDQRQFDPEGPDVRDIYGISSGTRLIATIGKLSKDRGFEAVLETFALVRKRVSDVRLMIIGHGEHRAALEAYAQVLGVAPDLIWAGYHEDDLAEHYRAADVLLFTARGSDEGHRAVLEAMACATLPAVYPIEGVSTLLDDLAPELISHDATPAALAEVVMRLVELPDLADLRRRVRDRSDWFAYDRAAARLLAVYHAVM